MREAERYEELFLAEGWGPGAVPAAVGAEFRRAGAGPGRTSRAAGSWLEMDFAAQRPSSKAGLWAGQREEEI